MAYFQPLSEQAVRDGLKRAREQARGAMNLSYNVAIDFLDDRAIQHVRRELHNRYQSHQSLRDAERIKPVHIPLTERFINESASAYNRPLQRKLLNAKTLELDKDATKALALMPGMSSINQTLHRCDQVATLLKSCAVWSQVRRGEFRLQSVVPQRVWPVASDEEYADPADPDDYMGFGVELGVCEDVTTTKRMRYAFLGAANHGYYTGEDAYTPDAGMTIVPNPMVWPQTIDELKNGIPTGRGEEKVLPLQMLTWLYHGEQDCLIPETDVSIGILNLEIDIAISAILHDLRMHGGSQLVLTLTDPDSPPGRLAMGSNFALAMADGETAAYIGNPRNWEETINAVHSIIRLYIVMKRQNPSDYSLVDVGPESGFAKAVASLPKMEARNERIEQLEIFESEEVWPRIGASADWLGGIFSAPASTWVMKTEFSEIEFPKNAQETTTEGEYRIKHGMDSPASLLAAEQGITEEEAQMIIDKRAAAAPKPQEAQGARSAFAAARRNRRDGGNPRRGREPGEGSGGGREGSGEGGGGGGDQEP